MFILLRGRPKRTSPSGKGGGGCPKVTLPYKPTYIIKRVTRGRGQKSQNESDVLYGRLLRALYLLDF